MSHKTKLHTCGECGDRTSNPAAHTCRPLAGPELKQGDRVLLSGLLRGHVHAIRTPAQIAIAVPQFLETCEEAAKEGARQMAIIQIHATAENPITVLIRTPTGWHNIENEPIEVEVMPQD